jgi:hypothetical protein
MCVPGAKSTTEDDGDSQRIGLNQEKKRQHPFQIHAHGDSQYTSPIDHTVHERHG